MSKSNATGAPAAKAAKATYLVKSPLNHNGELYAVTAEVELTEAEAAPLLGHTVEPKPEAATKAA